MVAAPAPAPSRALIVLVPGLSGDFSAWRPLRDRLSAEPELRDARWIEWQHGIGLFSLTPPEQLALDLRARIDQEWAKDGPFSNVILMGHSFGALLVRRAFLLACNADQTGQRAPWADVVSRIVLFAGINRGVDATRTWRFRLVSWLVRVFPPAQRLTRAHVFRGADFVANLRILWIRYFTTLGREAPVVVQLLGTRDSLVTHDDSIDVEQFPTACYVSIPEADHRTLYRLQEASDPDGRYALIREAVLEPTLPHGVNRTFTGPERVVFVLHGIRANNRTWVKQTQAAIVAAWPTVKVVDASYGYLSALAFAIPMRRRKHLRWFQDAYTESLARNPHARFSFVGHSNGTYLFGESLRRLPGMQFERAVLVGSVLPADYDWNERARRGQIQKLRVDGSCYDWPVGWLCSGLRGIGMRDVGTGGFDGFTSVGPEKTEFFWYAGGHSRPLEESNLPALAKFAVTGTVVPPSQIGQNSNVFSAVSRAARLLSPLVVLAAVGGLGFLLWSSFLTGAVVLGALGVVLLLLDIG